MADAAKSPIVICAVFLAVHAAQAAGPARRTEPDAVAARPAPNSAPPTLDGAQLFATHCAMRHKPAELARRLQGAADPKATRADMAAFLARHGHSDADADAASIDYLANSRAP